MSDQTVAIPSPNVILSTLGRVTKNWQTSLVGAALVGLGIASYFGVALPVVGGVHLTADQLLVSGLTALGFLVTKDGNK